MQSVSAKVIAMRLECLYRNKVMSYPRYQDMVNGCQRWFNDQFESNEEFQNQYLISDGAFVNVLASCLGSERRMLDFLCVCNVWAFWHFHLSIHESIKKLKLQEARTYYLAPSSDVQFLKKFALPFRWIEV